MADSFAPLTPPVARVPELPRPAPTTPLVSTTEPTTGTVTGDQLVLSPGASDAPAAAQSNVGPGRDARKAASEAERVFYGQGTTETVKARDAALAAGDRAAYTAAGYVEVGLGQHGYREVRQDADDVNRDRYDAIYRDPAKGAEAARQIAANGPLVTKALDRMLPGDRAKYRELASVVAGDREAHLALQLLVLDGRMDHDLVGTLHGMTAPGALHPSLPAAEVIGDLVQEIYVPSAINQQGANTCTATSIQILLARQAPAEYARLVAGLASPSGEVKLANGDTLTREPGSAEAQPLLVKVGEREVKSADYRSHPSRLLQDALMEYADGDEAYDAQRGTHSGGIDGMTTTMFARAAEGVGQPAGKVIDLHDVYNDKVEELQGLIARQRAATTPEEKAALQTQAKAIVEEMKTTFVTRNAEMVTDVFAALDRGQPVPIAVSGWRPVETDGKTHYVGDHALLAIRREGDQVVYLNPHGTEERMSRDDFASRVAVALVPPAP
ncbi:MAG: hypothetical protein JWM80_859 [Cyanobacteria bacterium RYN_339]|nr:hypothetical protein [Cyanobacteria bacterium RYN_339]